MRISYIIINWVFVGVVCFIFIYSGIYSSNKEHPVKCYYEQRFNKPCPTCGLSRGFSAMIRGKIKEVSNFNSNSIPVFCFFSIQLLLRLTINFLLIKFRKPQELKIILTTDIIFTTLIFILAFHRIILDISYRDKLSF